MAGDLSRDQLLEIVVEGRPVTGSAAGNRRRRTARPGISRWKVEGRDSRLAVRSDLELAPGERPVKERQAQLLQAIAGNDAFRVGALLSEDPGLVKARDAQGRTPILFSLYLGHDALARLIRERTPAPSLYEAAALGETELVQELLEASPDQANAVAKDGFCALGLAVYFGRTAAAELLLRAGANPDTPSANEFKVRPLHSAAAHRDKEVSLALVRLLLEWKADPNVAQAGGWTPLHQAAAHGRLETARLLLAHGASAEAKSDDGRTPLEMAQLKKHADVEALLEGPDA